MVDQAKPKPDAECAEYTEMAQDWKLIRDLMGGTRAMQDAGTDWLPQWPKETNARYKIRVEESTLFNGLERTIDVMASKPFNSPITFPTDPPEKLVPWLENIDLEGTRLDNYLHMWFRDALSVGLSHILVDSPSGGVVSKADEKAAGVRPYLVHITAENLIFWRSELIGGERRLTDVRISETVTEKKNEWEDIQVHQIRRLYLSEGRMFFEIWRKVEDSWVIYEEGVTAFDKIPLVTLYTKRTGFMTAVPPLLDLAWVNVTHWRSSSEQRHCLALGRRPFPFFSGFEKDELKGVQIGPHSGIRSSNPAADVKLIEINGASIDAGRQDLQDLKEEMAALGTELLVRKAVEKTATESQNEKDQTESQLGQMVKRLEDASEQVLGLMTEIAGSPEEVDIKIESDFGISTMTRDDLQALTQARLAGEISWQTYINGLARNGIVPEDIDLEEERAMIANEAAL